MWIELRKQILQAMLTGETQPTKHKNINKWGNEHTAKKNENRTSEHTCFGHI